MKNCDKGQCDDCLFRVCPGEFKCLGVNCEVYDSKNYKCKCVSYTDRKKECQFYVQKEPKDNL